MTAGALSGEHAMCSAKNTEKIATSSVPSAPIAEKRSRAVRRVLTAFPGRFAAIFWAVSRIITVGIPAAVTANTGEYSPYAVEK
ncbi:unknown [Eubacterium sp. CAG:786]|nr:unknown [Eubacterium sp. CAG:786]